MAKKKVTVNVEESVWLEFKKRAFRSQLEAGQNPSVSQYLENMISVKLELPIEARYDHKDLVAEVPVYIEGWRDPRDTVIDSDGKTQNEVISEHLKNQTEDIPSKIITKGSSIEDIRKLDSKITAHRIETKKGPVKANAALEGFFKPQPKAKWKGAK